MKSPLHLALLSAALLAVLLLADSWRSARRDAAQLSATLATQNATIQQAQAREKQRDAQLTSALTAMAAQKGKVRTPRQAAQAIPSVLPPLPLPVSIQTTNLSPLKPGETPPATITVPQPDLIPLYDALQDCRASALETDAAKRDLADEQSRTAALTRERDAATVAARGGTFWSRLKRSAKWFALGAAVGAVAAAAARR